MDGGSRLLHTWPTTRTQSLPSNRETTHAAIFWPGQGGENEGLVGGGDGVKSLKDVGESRAATGGKESRGTTLGGCCIGQTEGSEQLQASDG